MARSRKFTDKQVREIRANKDGKSQRELAREHKCSQQAIWRIQTYRSYKDVEDGMEGRKRV